MRSALRHPLYHTHKSMKKRTSNPNASNYKYYGGRGIKVCDRWLGKDGFWNFVEDMGDKPDPTYTLDRIDVNGDYAPENCRWSSVTDQNINQRVRPTSKSGYRGVTWHLSEKKWQATARRNRVLYHFGLFESAEEAHLARVNGVNNITIAR